MNAVLPWQAWLRIGLLLIVFPVVALHLLVLGFSFNALWSSLSTAIVVLVCVVVSGLWRGLWRLPFLGRHLRRHLPLIDGEYRGVQRSNWPRIEAVKEAAKRRGATLNLDDVGAGLPNLLETPVRATIRTTFFGVTVHLSSETGYAESHSLTASLKAAIDSQPAKLAFLFQARTGDTQASDAGMFQGAAELEIVASNPLTLRGWMCTNRMWHRGLNTAGQIELVWDRPVEEQ